MITWLVTVSSRHVGQGLFPLFTWGRSPVSSHHVGWGHFPLGTWGRSPVSSHHVGQGHFPLVTWGWSSVSSHHMGQGHMYFHFVTLGRSPIFSHHVGQITCLSPSRGAGHFTSFLSRVGSDHAGPPTGHPCVSSDLSINSIQEGMNNWTLVQMQYSLIFCSVRTMEACLAHELILANNFYLAKNTERSRVRFRVIRLSCYINNLSSLIKYIASTCMYTHWYALSD